MHCVDLGESFPTSIYLQKSASIQPRTSPSKFGGKFNSLFICLLSRDLFAKRFGIVAFLVKQGFALRELPVKSLHLPPQIFHGAVLLRGAQSGLLQLLLEVVPHLSQSFDVGVLLRRPRALLDELALVGRELALRGERLVVLRRGQLGLGPKISKIDKVCKSCRT